MNVISRCLVVGVAVLLISFAVATGAVAQWSLNESDRAALEAIYHATDGPNWDDSHNWLTDEPFWFGVQVDDNGRVTALFLQRNNLSGTIPVPELAQLTNLRDLGLYNNNLTGTIPAELGRVTNLEHLQLYNNNLSGSVPTELGQLTNLISLGLSNTNLSGSVPAELGQLTNLLDLALHDNNLSGPLPAELGQLTNLQRLGLNENNLSGSIPVELGQLINLVNLALDADTGLCLPLDFPEDSQFARLARQWGVPDCGSDTEPKYCPVTPQSTCQMSVVPLRVNTNALQHGEGEGECTECSDPCKKGVKDLNDHVNQKRGISAWLSVDLIERFFGGCAQHTADSIGLDGFLGASERRFSYMMESSDPSILSVSNEPDGILIEMVGSGNVTLWVTAIENSKPFVRLATLIAVSTPVPALPAAGLAILAVLLSRLCWRRLHGR